MSESIETNGNGFAIKGLSADRVWTYSAALPTVDFKVLTQRTVDLACVRAFGHVLMSEVASKVGSEIDKRITAGTATKEDRDSKSALYTTLRDEYRAEYIESFVDDTWGLGSRGPTGPRLDPVEAIYQRELEKETRVYFNSELGGGKGAPYDKTEKVWTVKRRDASGELVTVKWGIEPACEYFLKRKPDAQARIMTLAQNMVAARIQANEAKKAAEATAPALEDEDVVV